MHKRGVIHRDINPQNIVLERKASEVDEVPTIQLIDFGLATFWRAPDALEGFSQRTETEDVGTWQFASDNTLAGLTQCRGDDLTCLALTLIYLIQGSLPWTHIGGNDHDAFRKITSIKATTTTLDMTADAPVEFGQFLDYAKGLGWWEKPDYCKWKGIFSLLALSSR